MKKVLIIYRFLPQYRIDFYNLLREKLRESNIELSLVYGKLNNTNSSKGDEVNIDWAEYLHTTKFKIADTELLWQPCLQQIKGKDLIIVEQANKLIINYYLMIKRKLSSSKVAFWGHGLDSQALPGSFANRFKKLIIKQTDWWFTYTEGVKKIVTDCGFSEEKITVVQNAIDTTFLQLTFDKISEEEVRKEKEKLKISSENIGIYCGALYKEKRIDFLINSAVRIKEKSDDFHLIILGAGPDINIVNEATGKYKWIHYLGTKFGEERVVYFKMSKLFLLPGAVGLAVLDAFSMQTPMITVEYPFHGPEVEYIVNEVNGLVTKNNLKDYTSKVLEILNSDEKYNKLVEGCKSSTSQYTVEKMVENFSQGIVQCVSNS